MKILLIDDQEMFRASLVVFIPHVVKDAVVSSARTFEEATKLLETEQFDLIFLDVNFKYAPQASIAAEDAATAGLTYLSWLKKEREIETPVVMISGEDDERLVKQSLELGAKGFIPKFTDDLSALPRAVQIVSLGGVYIPPPSTTVSPRPSIGDTAAPVNIPVVTADELGLSPRLYEAVSLVSEGCANKVIARRMHIEEDTAAEHVKKAFAKISQVRSIKVTNRMEFMLFLYRNMIQLAPPSDCKQVVNS